MNCDNPRIKAQGQARDGLAANKTWLDENASQRPGCSNRKENKLEKFARLSLLEARELRNVLPIPPTNSTLVLAGKQADSQETSRSSRTCYVGLVGIPIIIKIHTTVCTVPP